MRDRWWLLVVWVTIAIHGHGYGQAWSGILDRTRAIDWGVSAYETIPNVTAQCGATIAPYTGSAATINTAIQNCSAGQFVHLGTGTFTLSSSINLNKAGVVLRGDGPTKTILGFTGVSVCITGNTAVCMRVSGFMDEQNANVQPGGSNSCSWTAGYTQGSTSITLNGCGSPPPVNQYLVLDQANDVTDTNGVFQCDIYPNCKETNGTNTDGRIVGGVTRSQMQAVYVSAVSGSGSGPYTLTISPGLYANSWRSSQSPGAWWEPQLTQAGIEAVTIDNSSVAGNEGHGQIIAMGSCYGCWVRNVRSILASRAHVNLYLGMRNIIRDSYFFNSYAHANQSYGIEPFMSGDVLIENNIFQQISSPITPQNSPGMIVGYNYTVDNFYGTGNWMQVSYSQHNAGQTSVLFEGNLMNGFSCDNVWGSGGVQTTLFRNRFMGTDDAATLATYPIEILAGCRGLNIIGNVLGTVGYHNNYEVSLATSSANCNTSIYELDWSSGPCQSGNPTPSGLVHSTLMRWGNYDVVTGADRWNTSEGQPSAVPFINANAIANPGSHTLPDSLYLSGKPSWWSSSKPFPAFGPGVSSGNVGQCTGTKYPQAACTTNAECGSGNSCSSTLSEAVSVPAMDCYLNVMQGSADGTGSVLSFDANACYSGSGGGAGPPAPGGLQGVGH